jgi:CubicO group peptidase (beta-lactamase class C family)
MERSTPSAEGVEAAGILRFLDAIERDPRVEPHGLIVQRHGRRIVEGYWAPHGPDRLRLVYSLSKTFTGTALGLQVGEDRLSLDDLVSDHLPELFDGVDAATRRMKIRHIASMSTGHDRETLLEASTIDPDDPIRGFLEIPPDEEPGTLFAYNQPPVLALATILQRLAGQRLVDYLRPRLLEPVGINDLRWTRARSGVDLGYSGVHTNLDAIARLGQLYLDDGVWDGRRILPEGWVADASSVHIANPQREEPDWRQGYGFQLWMARHGYRGDGAFGQYMVVLPEQDAVVVMFSCTEPMQVVLDLMWQHLLPAMGPAERPASHYDVELSSRLDALALPTAAERLGGTSPAVPASCFDPGPLGPTSQRSVTSIETDPGRMVLHEPDGSIEVPLTERWAVVDATVAASAAGLAGGRVAVDLVFLASPHRLEVELDPSTSTFVTRWPLVPLFGAGNMLTSIRPPAD